MPSAASTAQSPGPGGARILVAEDSRPLQMIAEAQLRRLGHRVGLAANGQEALQRLQQETFHLVLMDIHMPELDGIAATRLIRASEDPRIAATPIIALTACAMKGDEDSFLDGANVELLEALGPDNLFIFGLTADQVARLHRDGYRPQDYWERQPALQNVLAMIEQDHFNASEPGLFAGLVHDLRTVDYYCLLADFEDYVRAQDAVSARFRDRPRWTRQSIICAARMGRFSSDRAIGEYNRLIWGLQPTPIPGDRF